MSWSSAPNTSSIHLDDHDLYIWIYEYILNYLLRFIVPFISLSVVVFRTNMALTPLVDGFVVGGYGSGGGSNSSYGSSGSSNLSFDSKSSSAAIEKMKADGGSGGVGNHADRCQLMSIGVCLLALVCYAPFLVNYAIYAAWILDDSEAAAAAVAGDVSVRKFNTFCYVFIMAGSAFRIGVYAMFNPDLIFVKSSCCRYGRVAKRKLFGADVDRYGRAIGGGGGGGGGVVGVRNNCSATNGSASMNGYDNHVFRY